MVFTQLVQANLQTRILGRHIDYYPRLESTNNEAMRLIEEGAEEGTVVITDTQSAGRGRMKRLWFSSPGKGLTFSVILRPGMESHHAGLLALMSGIAVAEALNELHLKPLLKWPNDILLSGKKCGGILVESKFRRDVMSSAVIGIGINVNERIPDFPEELHPTTTSIALEKVSPVQRELVLACILNCLEMWYKRLRSGMHDTVISAWQARCAHLGKEVSFERHGQTETGIFAGVNDGGAAIIETASGQDILSSEEISLDLKD